MDVIEFTYKIIRTIIVLAIILLLVFFLKNLIIGKDAHAVEPPESRYFTVQEVSKVASWYYNAEKLSKRDLEDKIVLFNFCDYTSDYCRRVLPELNQLQNQYSELVIIGIHSPEISTQNDLDAIKHIAKKFSINHNILIDQELLLNKNLIVRSWPSFVLFDRSGKPYARVSGNNISDRVSPYVDELLVESE